jgi:hypothetical protein
MANSRIGWARGRSGHSGVAARARGASVPPGGARAAGRRSQALRGLGLAAACGLLLATGTGCKLMAYGATMWGTPPTRTIPAEWPHLAGKKVCVVVWAEMDTLFEYPFVQLEVARHIEDAMAPVIERIRFVPSQEVVDYQQRDAEWDRKPSAEIGAHFGADRVIFVELTQYTTREPDSPHLYRGRISGNVKVYDPTYPTAGPLYRTTVDTVYPPDTPGQYGSDDISIRKAAMEAFAKDVMGKFADRKEKL